jgi:hypothetical protein
MAARELLIFHSRAFSFPLSLSISLWSIFRRPTSDGSSVTQRRSALSVFDESHCDGAGIAPTKISTMDRP